jgi:hypothetical protein
MDNKRAQLAAQQNYQQELDRFNYESEQRAKKASRLLPQIVILPILIVVVLALSYPTWRVIPALPMVIGGIGIAMEVFIVMAYLAYRREKTPPQPPTY